MRRGLFIGAILSATCFVVGWLLFTKPATRSVTTGSKSAVASREANPTSKPAPRKRAQKSGNLTLFWDGFTDELKNIRQDTGLTANIHREDYAGPEACQNCHKKQHAAWSEHPHRWMNAKVDAATIKGDFADRKMTYLGGDITFTKVDDQFRMRFQRGDIKKEFAIDQTIGSRYFQYYVGKQLVGPEPLEHPLYSESHVLPIGYWLDRKEWIPIVHVHDDFEDKTRFDPFASRGFTADDKDPLVYASKTSDLYRAQCNYCHTTFPVGDMMVRDANLIGSYAPAVIDLSLPDYLAKTRPNLWPENRESHDLTVDAYKALLKEVKYSDAREHAVTLGISCEACHLGAKEHAQGKLKKPKFFPYSPEFAIRADKGPHDMGRTHDNINYACSRCHNGSRQLYAAGMSTWNSTEYTDATRGACYSQLTCVKCHDPHVATGQAWTKTSLQDDAICLSCHKQLEPAEKRMAHTHHSLDNEGSRCMNCHMPRINEGLQEVVRTHTIFSPTNRAMIESNQMNACNQCHVDKPIDWTTAYLKDWYKAGYSDAEITKNYPDRKAPAAINWLKGKSENVRLVAADTLARANAKWALPELIDALDDRFMLNRQFTRIGLERMLGIKLSDFKYEFFLTAEERKEPIKKMKEALLPPDVKAAAR